MVRRSRRVHAHELLGRSAARPLFIEVIQTPAPRRLCVPHVQNCAARWRILALCQLQAILRHLRNWRCLPQLRSALRCHRLPRLRPPAPHGRMGRSNRLCSKSKHDEGLARFVGTCFPEINPFYATHQLFRLAAFSPPRYSSLFQSVETSHFNFPVFVMWLFPNPSVFEGD